MTYAPAVLVTAHGTAQRGGCWLDPLVLPGAGRRHRVCTNDQPAAAKPTGVPWCVIIARFGRHFRVVADKSAA